MISLDAFFQFVLGLMAALIVVLVAVIIWRFIVWVINVLIDLFADGSGPL